MIRSSRLARVLVAVALAAGTVGALVGPAGASATGQPPGEDGTVALIGQQDHGQAEAADLLREAGLDVVAVVEAPRDELEPAVIEATDLVLLTVSATDGPMPGTLQVLEALDGSSLDRVALLLTRTDINNDAELIELVTLEAFELAGSYGLAASMPVLTAESPTFVDDVIALLSGPAEGAAVVAPTTTVPTTSSIPGVDGLDLERATALLESEGLVVSMIADPALPVEVTCAPAVRRQIPEAGLVVPRGTTVGVITGLRASSLGCDVPVLSAEELDAAIDAVWQQPGLPPRFVTMPVVTNNIPLSTAQADLEALGLVVDAVPTAGNFGVSCDPPVETQVPEAGTELERGMTVLLAINVDLDYSGTPGAPGCRIWDAVSLDDFEAMSAAVFDQL